MSENGPPETATATLDAPEPGRRTLTAQLPAAPAARAMIVGDDAAAEAGQLTQSAFLAQLREAVTATASDVLGPTWSASTCADIPRLFAHYAALDPQACDRLMRRYAGLATPSSALEYLAPICGRISGAIARWGRGAELSWELGGSGLPAALEGGGAAAPASAPAPASTPAASVQLKRTTGAADATGAGISLDDLGPGARLDGCTAARMGAAFGGERFDDVSIHTGPEAGRTARALGADAMALGSHIAFASGGYEPGTPAGDGLIAHELAHVMQQRGGEPLAQRRAAQVEPGDAPHERDADDVADAVVARLHPDPAAPIADTGAPIRPALTTGLGVRRGNKPDKPAAAKEAPARRVVELVEPTAEEKREAITDACKTLMPTALRLVKGKYKDRFKYWQDSDIQSDYSMREGIQLACTDDAGEGTIGALVRHRMCATAEAARDAILAEFDRLHPQHAPRELVIATPESAKLAGFKARYYDKDYTGQAALIAAIIKAGAEYAPSSYSRDRVDDVVGEFAARPVPDLTAEEILADKTGDYYRAVVGAYNAALDRTSGAKGMGTQLGNATGAHYSGMMKFQ
ncbi:MAG: DUF4157 domain-containing protein [Deltaproteobacteria bacterium]|nr:DUF4157 domain-containing protein [Deltaproteobacteria bacterium]